MIVLMYVSVLILWKQTSFFLFFFSSDDLNNEKEKHRLQLFWIGVVDAIVEKCGEFLNVKNGKAKQEGGFHECSLAREGISFQ